jgi:hypothetical protein
MKTWMEERDLFIAQTMMFVNEIVASTPGPASPQSVAVPVVLKEQPQTAAVPIVLKLEQPQTVAAPIGRKVEQAQSVAVPIVLKVEQLQTAAVPIDRKVEQSQTDAVPIDRKVEQAIRVEPEVPPEAVARVIPLPIVDERAEITKRIAAFKAHQARFSQERDRFFRSMMAKIESQRPGAKAPHRLKMK